MIWLIVLLCLLRPRQAEITKAVTVYLLHPQQREAHITGYTTGFT